MIMSICTLDWWRDVVEAWNVFDGADCMKRFGVARFDVFDSDLPPVHVAWDADGRAEVVGAPEGSFTIFAATLENWRGFVAGDFTAMEGALAGRIKIKGNALGVLPYTTAFTRLAQVARTVAGK